MKNKFITVILVIVMLIPTVIAIINYAMMQGGEAGSYNTVSVKLVDTKNNEYIFERDGEKSDMMHYFLKTISNAEEVQSLPVSIEQNYPYILTVKTTADKFAYKFYYTTNAQDCYFVNTNDGKTFRLNKDDAQSFLKGSYSASLFENGTAPTLTVSGNSTSPDSSLWKFKNVDEEYVEFDSSAIVKEECESISLEGGLSFDFTVKPDSLTLKITDKKTGGEDYAFNGDLTTLSSQPIPANTDVTVEALAKWYEDANRTYYGEQTYSFDAFFTSPAEFYTGVTEIQIGEFICVTGLNVKDPSKITFQSEPDIHYSPVFYSDSETDSVIALIPFNWNLTAGNYALTFNYGGSSKTLDIALKDRGAFDGRPTFKDRTVTITGADNLIGEKGKAEEVLREIAKADSSVRYWDIGETLYYDDETDTDVLYYKYGFGDTLNVKGTEDSFRNTGVDFTVRAEGKDIKANLGGEIVYAGRLDYCGYTVVIDHGYGLKSWYAHLGSISVEVGDTVKKGDAIGQTGDSVSYVPDGNMHIGMTIFDTPICTYAIWKNGHSFDDTQGIRVYQEEN